MFSRTSSFILINKTILYPKVDFCNDNGIQLSYYTNKVRRLQYLSGTGCRQSIKEKLMPDQNQLVHCMLLSRSFLAISYTGRDEFIAIQIVACLWLKHLIPFLLSLGFHHQNLVFNHYCFQFFSV